MDKLSQSTAVPKLRFPEFQRSTGWARTPLSSVLFEQGLKSDGASEVHSVSLSRGVVPQVEHLGRAFSAADTSHYSLVRPFDIVYTKSPLAIFKLGIVKQHRGPQNALVSPLYGVFKPKNPHVGYLLEAYFDSPARSLRYLDPLAQKGAKNTIQISNERFLSGTIFLPGDENEQQKIADCLTSLDQLLAAQRRMVEALETHKRGLLQRLFPRESEILPRLRFPEYRDSPAWQEKMLAASIDLVSGMHLSPQEYSRNGEMPYFTGPSDFTNDLRRVTKWTGASANTAKRHDTLITVKGSGAGEIWYLEIASVAMGRQLMAVRAKSSSSRFIFQLLLTKRSRLEDLAAGNLIPGLARGDILDLVALIPEVDEQDRIADCLFSLDARIVVELEKLDELMTHKRGLMQRLFPAPRES